MIALRTVRKYVTAFVLGELLGLPVDVKTLVEYDLTPIITDIVRNAQGEITSATLTGWSIKRRSKQEQLDTIEKWRNE